MLFLWGKPVNFHGKKGPCNFMRSDGGGGHEKCSQYFFRHQAPLKSVWERFLKEDIHVSTT